ncbi:MAG TPA: glutathione S-transferase family protein [Alphaproteobacteria bacterium]|nr:glutathione S-transferase family protein [Alphaproteobacteria bacterium]
MEPPVLFHDPTSEPSRAVHWFALEASIPLELHYIWLTRNEHLGPELLAVNPRHQVPAMRHGDFCLSEATAIIRYLAEIAGVEAEWLGHTIRGRARVNMLLSWYHTNLRKLATLDYFLPVLLVPGYMGLPRPPDEAIESLRGHIRGMLGQLDEFLGPAPYLGGERPTVPDLVFAPALFALDCDPGRDAYMGGFPRLIAWLERLRRREGCAVSHKAWRAVAPLVRQRLQQGVPADGDPSWVADACERALGIRRPAGR